MRSILVNTVTWILIACGAFLFVGGGLDYWQSKSAQQQIASEWNREQAAETAPPQMGVPSPGDTRMAPALPADPPNPENNLPGRPKAFPRKGAVSLAPAQGAALLAPRQGAALARLSIPRLHAVLYVVEGDDSGDLKRAPGHLIGTALPGQTGNCVIAGHRDTHFRVLKDIQKGDEILLSRAGETFRYRVDELSVVSADNLNPLEPTRSPVLNLITCYPFYYIGSAPRRFIVHARLEKSDEPLRAAAAAAHGKLPSQ